MKTIIGILTVLVLAGCEEPAQETAQTVETTQPIATPTPTPIPGGLIETPPVQILTVEGHALILEFETSGRSGYNPRPEWPGGASGPTIAIGYDLGYSTKSVINSDWQALDASPRARLAAVSGITGQRARAITPQLHDIIVRWDLAIDVFDNIDVARWQAASRRALPGFTKLRLNCQAALISLGFNRGWAMAGPNRSEMRDIRDYGVPREDYPRIAQDLRSMSRIWRGTANERGLTRRRNAEADLVLTP
jgi:hypothetical protein